MNNPAPGFAKHPDHTVLIAPHEGDVTIVINGFEIARTDGALILSEASYPDVFYLPKATIPNDMLIENDHRTYCPFKGTASYYDLVHKGKTHKNAAWTYRGPFDEALEIKGYIAIYAEVATVSPA